MIVISDTSAISNFAQIQEIKLLKEIYGRVIIPPEVHQELLKLKEFGVAIEKILAADWVLVQEVRD